ncbi:MAG: hypothetical protein D6705_07735 [Deltaproteobacteria bacterium]|nr:MAG: hypothetical protein D6705_07735 [Deltaproteobacteria bacterium]
MRAPRPALGLLLALFAGPTTACDDGAGDGASTTGSTTGGDGSGCFLHATIVQEDGTVVENDAAYIYNRDSDRYGLIPDYGQTLTHDLSISWPADLPPGTYAVNDEHAVGFIVITADGAGNVLGGAWPSGTVTFTSIEPQLSGTAVLEPREPLGNPLSPVEIRDVEFGCP